MIYNKASLMLFDLMTVGHHTVYIQHIAKYWIQKEKTGCLTIVVSPDFIEKNISFVKATCDDNVSNQIRFTSISHEDFIKYKEASNTLSKSLIEWKLYCKYAEEVNPHHALLMYFDIFQVGMLLGARSPCTFSGIYFRPTFHYKYFFNYQPSWQESLREWRKKILLYMTLRVPEFKNLFSLDPYAVNYIKGNVYNKKNVVHLPDPVLNLNELDRFQSNLLRQHLEIDPKRKVFLLFGALEKRKGIFESLESIKLLPAELLSNLCILLAGKVAEADVEKLNNMIEKISLDSPVQIVLIDSYISDADISQYFDIADAVLAPYQKHVGMSGVLLLAAAAQKPIISSDYGLMGHLVRKYQLGLSIKSTSAPEIAAAIEKIISSNNTTNIYSSDNARQLVRGHSIDAFCETILQECKCQFS